MTQATEVRLPIKALYVAVTGVFFLVAIGLAVGVPAGIASAVTSDKPMSIPATVAPGELGDLSEIGVVNRVSVSLPIDHLSPIQVAVYHGTIAVAGLVLLFGLWQLRQLVRSVREGDPFSGVNVRRLRILGSLLLLAYPVFQYVLGGLHEWILSTGGPSSPPATVDADPFSLVAVFGGLCLLVLAEVFAHGIRLREDVEATV